MNDEWGSNNNATDVILMRVEEMYLIKAEAQAMNNDVSGGVNTLNSFVNTYVIRLINVQLQQVKLCRKLFGISDVSNSGVRV